MMAHQKRAGKAMFIGHFALAFGAKKLVPETSLGVLFVACQLADLIWPNLVLLGFERLAVEPGNTALTPLNFLHYPYSHSLVASLVWSGLFALAYMLLAKQRWRTAGVIALLVFSHWLLDWLTHRPDLPITIGGPTRVGLGLWNVPALAIGLEALIFAAGVWIYQRNTLTTNRTGSIGLWALVGFLAVVYALNIVGPPPPSAAAVAWSAQAMWLLVAWAFWVDRNRVNADHAVARHLPATH